MLLVATSSHRPSRHVEKPGASDCTEFHDTKVLLSQYVFSRWRRSGHCSDTELPNHRCLRPLNKNKHHTYYHHHYRDLCSGISDLIMTLLTSSAYQGENQAATHTRQRFARRSIKEASASLTTTLLLCLICLSFATPWRRIEALISPPFSI
jgi:hypothetical protein